MKELHIDGLDRKVYTLEAYAKALTKKYDLSFGRMPGGKCKLFFSTKLIGWQPKVAQPYTKKLTNY